MTKAYSYLRFSTPEQMKGDSLRRQTDLAVKYAKAHNLTLDTELTYHDLGVSGFKGKNFEAGALGMFLEAAEAKVIPEGSYLLVESLDRVSRQIPRKAARILERICEAGINVVTLNDNKVYNVDNLDNDNGMSLMMVVLQFVRAHDESKMKSQRVGAAWHNKRQEALKDGTPLTSKGPSWLRLDKATGKWELIPEKVDVVRRVYLLASQGLGTQSIAKKFNDEKVPTLTPAASQWFPGVIGSLLRSKAVIGFHTPNLLKEGKRIPQEDIPNYYPVIINEELYQQAQAVRTSRNPRKGVSPVTHNIFGGLCVCGLCGTSMNMVVKNSVRYSHRYLVCAQGRYGAGCKYAAVNYQQLEERFLLDCDAILNLMPSTDGSVERRLLELASTISAVNDQRQAASDGYLRTRDEVLLSRLIKLRDELADLKAEEKALLVKQEQSSGLLVQKRVENLKAALRNLPLDRQVVNGLVRSLFSGISLNADTGIATLAWQHGGESKFVFALPIEMRPSRKERNRGNLKLGTGQEAVKIGRRFVSRSQAELVDGEWRLKKPQSA